MSAGIRSAPPAGGSGALPDVLVTACDTRPAEGCIRSLLVEKPENTQEHIGFNLTRSQWDPYPWVRSVDGRSAAGRAGLREGDCLLRVDDSDLLGLKVSEAARLLRNAARGVRLLVWSSGPLADWDPEALFCGPLPGALRRLGSCLAGVLRAAECPVCHATVAPPATQCPRGHLLCAPCRGALAVCPLCRAPLPPPPAALRNLLADEVYNSVVDAFELRPEQAGRLTHKLFGEEARYLQREPTLPQEELFQEHDGPKGIKWGTQRLLQRLLPGRARSTGNIARASSSGHAENPLTEERDLSRSLSTLDITRCREPESSSLNSLACTAGGSCGSLPATAFSTLGSRDVLDMPGFVDEEVESSPDSSTTNIIHVPLIGYHCPLDPDCEELITGSIQQHLLQVHGQKMLLSADTRLTLKPNPEHCPAVLLPNAVWFYPKCERDEREHGVRVWCWAEAASDVSSCYQIAVEVWSKSNGQLSNNPQKRETHVNGKDVNSNEVYGKKARSLDRMYSIDEYDDLEEESQDVITEIKQSMNGRADAANRGPLLRYVAPVQNLRNASWKKVLESRQALFLSDSLLANEAQIQMTIDKI